MRKSILLFLFMIIASLLVFAQQNRNQKDKYGRKQGVWKQYDQTGNLRYEGQFKDNLAYGEFRYYYPNGNIRAISNMKSEGKQAYTKIFHRNGKLMAEGKYVEQKKDSVWSYYSEYDGILLSEETYDCGSREGLWKNYYPNRNVAEIYTYKNNLKKGDWKQFYTDGSLKLVCTYENNQKNGLFRSYHPNGQIELKGYYKNDMKVGEWQEFDKDGKKIETKN